MSYARPLLGPIMQPGGWHFPTRTPLPSLRYQLRLNLIDRIKSNTLRWRAIKVKVIDL